MYLHHPSSLEHDTGDHPEQPARIVAIERELESRDWLGYEREQAPRAERAVVEGLHPSAYIQRIEEICAQGGGMLDLDTVASARSFDAAMHSAGGSVRAVEALLSGEAEITFCGLRPPGHHAEAARAMGFCLFNNVAIAARRALDGLGAERVLVLDWDVHHGNGTNDIFYDADAVLYFSIHQSPLYPGTGSLNENGAGAGLGYTINLPVPPGAGHEDWLSLLEHVVAPVARAYRPDLLLVSAGFDAHRDDPVGGCMLETSSYAELIRQALTLGVPVGAVLEGGYDLDALADSTAAVMETLVPGGEPAAHPVEPVTERAAAVVGRYWPL